MCVPSAVSLTLRPQVALAFQLGPEVRATPRPGEAAADIGQVMGSFRCARSDLDPRLNLPDLALAVGVR